MRDVHCHIVPGVDDGSRNLDESIAMLHAARRAGITEIVATPHCRGSHFSRKQVLDAFDQLQRQAQDMRLTLAFEVYYGKLIETGTRAAGLLRNPETDEFLLELPTGAAPLDLDRTIFELQGQGLHVTIAHPERCRYVQEDLDVAYDWVESGCKLQVSANFLDGGFTSKSRRAATKLLKEGLVSYIASDAHCPEHYPQLQKAMEKYKDLLR